MADKFVPVATSYDDAVKIPSSERDWRVMVDTGSGLADVTAKVFNNTISGRGSETRPKVFTVKLRNADGAIGVGAYAEAACRLDVRVGGSSESYVTIFTGYVSKDGAQRNKKNLTADTVTLTMEDRRIKESKHKNEATIFTNFKPVDTASTSASILHVLAGYMGIGTSDIVAVTVNYTKDYVGVKADSDPWKELRTMAEAYKALVTIRYDGKLLFDSRFQNSWAEPTTEWTLDGDFVHSYQGRSLGIQANRVTSSWIQWELLAEQVIYANTENWDEDTQKCDIDIASSAYWPTAGSAGDKAQLQWKDPQTGEKFPLATNVQTPTIGAFSSTADIGYDDSGGGGAPTLTSFQGSTSATNNNPEAAEIILRGHASGSEIERLEVRGRPLRKVAERTIQRVDGSISSDEDYVDKKIDGKYGATDAQLDETVGWWQTWGSSVRTEYQVKCHFFPQVQEGAVVTFNPHSGINLLCYVQEYRHTCTGPMGSWYSVLILREKDAITVSSSPTIIEPVESQPAPKVGIFVTKKEHIQGYTNTFAGGTTVPAQVTIVAAASKGAKGANLIVWDRQLNLTNFDRYEIQASADNSVWYSLKFDLTDWKDTQDADTDVLGESLVHTIPPATDPATGDPVGRALYYRVRRITKAPVVGSWSSAVQITSTVVDTGDIAANAITTNKIDTTVLSTLAAVIRDSITILGNSGFTGFVGQKEVFTIACVADSSGSLGGKYFDFSSPTQNFRGWIDVANGSTIPDTANKVAIEVNIAANDSNSTVATAVASAINANASFTASADGATVTVTNVKQGVCTDATAGNSGFTMSVTTQGSDPDNPVNGDRTVFLDSDEVVIRERRNGSWVTTLQLGGTVGSETALQETIQSLGLRSSTASSLGFPLPDPDCMYFDIDEGNGLYDQWGTAFELSSAGRTWTSGGQKFGTHKLVYANGGSGNCFSELDRDIFTFFGWDLGEDLTVSFWVAFASGADLPDSGWTQTIFWIGDASNPTTKYLELKKTSINGFSVSIYTAAGADQTIIYNGFGSTNETGWHHVALVWTESANTCSITIDGTTQTQSFNNPADGSSIVTAYIGEPDSGTSNDRNISVDDFMIGLGVATATEKLERYYSSGLPWAKGTADGDLVLAVGEGQRILKAGQNLGSRRGDVGSTLALPTKGSASTTTQSFMAGGEWVLIAEDKRGEAFDASGSSTSYTKVNIAGKSVYGQRGALVYGMSGVINSRNESNIFARRYWIGGSGTYLSDTEADVAVCGQYNNDDNSINRGMSMFWVLTDSLGRWEYRNYTSDNYAWVQIRGIF